MQFYGAFAAALSYIIYSATKNRSDITVLKTTKLYRGISLDTLEIDSFTVGSRIHLPGYTSTSKKLEVAFKFANHCQKQGFAPVVFEIIFDGNSGLFELTEEYTAYPGEDEVLL